MIFMLEVYESAAAGNYMVIVDVLVYTTVTSRSILL